MARPNVVVSSILLVKLQGASIYTLEIPQRGSAAIVRRGPVPIVAALNGAVEIQACLFPWAGIDEAALLQTRGRRVATDGSSSPDIYGHATHRLVTAGVSPLPTFRLTTTGTE